MGRKLYVGGLSWGIDDDGLRRAFEGFGEVTEAQVNTNPDTGRSRGFGFVTFLESDDAEAAIHEMDGSLLYGQSLTVDGALERASRGARREKSYGRGRGRGW